VVREIFTQAIKFGKKFLQKWLVGTWKGGELKIELKIHVLLVFERQSMQHSF